MAFDESIQDADFASIPAPSAYFRLFVAVVNGEGALAYTSQTSENGPFDASFTTFPGVNVDPAPLQANVSMDGYVALLAQQANGGSLIYIAENREGPDRFGAPVDLGMPDGVTRFADTALLRGLDGMVNVIGVNAEADGAIWWKFQNAPVIKLETFSAIPPGTDKAVDVTAQTKVPPSQIWSDWQQIPGTMKSLRALNNADGRLILTGLDGANVPFINFQAGLRPFLPEKWEGWQDMQGGLSGFEQIEIGMDAGGIVHLFARIGARIYSRYQAEVSQTDFTPWVLFAAYDAPVHDFTLGTDKDGGLYLVAQVGSQSDSPLYASFQTGSTPAAWSGPKVIGHGEPADKLVLRPNADMELSLFALSSGSGALGYVDQVSADHWTAVWTGLGSGYRGYAVTCDITPTPSS